MWTENKPKRCRPKGSKNTRPRVSKKPRSECPVALGSQVASSSSSRCAARWSAEAKGYALAVYDRCAKNVAAAVRLCLREKPTMFGSDRGFRSNGKKAAALSEQLLTTWVAARDNAKSNSVLFGTAKPVPVQRGRP